MDRASGSYHSRYVQVGRQFGRRLYLSGDYSTSLSVVRFSRSDGLLIETRPQTRRVSGTVTGTLTRAWSMLLLLEHQTDPLEGEGPCTLQQDVLLAKREMRQGAHQGAGIGIEIRLNAGILLECILMVPDPLPHPADHRLVERLEHRDLETAGPRAFGYDLDYLPVEALNDGVGAWPGEDALG